MRASIGLSIDDIITLLEGKSLGFTPQDVTLLPPDNLRKLPWNRDRMIIFHRLEPLLIDLKKV